ncbi:MAG: divalent metal cation transporter, partial [Paraburkholderia tropica]
LTLVGLMTGGALIAILFHACRVDAVRACYWSALANGMTVTPVLFLLVLLSRHREAVGALKTHVVVQLLSWFAVMATGAALTAHTLLEIF